MSASAEITSKPLSLPFCSLLALVRDPSDVPDVRSNGANDGPESPEGKSQHGRDLFDSSLEFRSAPGYLDCSPIGVWEHGVVYGGEYLGNPVAIKMVAPHFYRSSKDGVRFADGVRKELELKCRIGSHPNLVACYGGSVFPPHIFWVEDLVDHTLQDVMYGEQRTKLPLQNVLRLMKDVLLGLQHLHSLKPKVIHKSLTPQNICVNKGRALLHSFGGIKGDLERLSDEAAHYLPPEVVAGEVSDKMDIFAFGVIFWECLVGTKPWSGYYEGLSKLNRGVAILSNVTLGVRMKFPKKFYQLNGMAVGGKIKHIVESCWLSDPEQRPDCPKLIAQLEEVEKQLLF